MPSERPETVNCVCDTHDEDVLICRCEEVTRAEILQAIKEGARTINDIKRRTRAGMGLCQGKTCRRLIQRILAQESDQEVDEIMPSTFRPPVRPIPLDVLAGQNED